jgi:hypothetical protein
MNDIKIEKNIPLPKKQGKKITYPVFYEMEVGDSVFIKTENRLFNPYRGAELKGRKFSKRYDDKKRGFRIWRIA